MSTHPISLGFATTLLPALTALIAFVFAALVFRRWYYGRKLYSFFWGAGLVFYSTGAAMEALYGLAGWNPFVFRLWYVCGAFFAAAWLGLGTAFLLMKRWAWVLLAVLAAGSAYAVFRVFTATLDPTQMLGHEMSGHAIVTPGVRVLTPFFNVFGTLLLVGGAAYSAWLFWRKRVLRNRMIGNILIAAGALLPAFGGVFQRAGVPALLYLSELLGVIVMFIGFQYAVSESAKAARKSKARATST